MRISYFRTIGLAGAFAVAALVLAPVQATAQLDKCSKEISKNAGKGVFDVSKELQKCVDGQIKEELKAASLVADKGKTIFEASKNLNKAAEKCQKSLDKLGLGSTNIASDDKLKLGKVYGKLTGESGLPKFCTDQDIQDLGHLSEATYGDTFARIQAAGALAAGWDTQLRTNHQSSRAFQAMAGNRCTESGVACESSADCDPDNVGDNCGSSACPNCNRFARGASAGSGGSYGGPCPTLACSFGDNTAITSKFSSINENLGVTAFNPLLGPKATIDVQFAGATSLNACDVDTIFGDVALMASDARTSRANAVGTRVCITGNATNGYIRKAGSGLPGVDTSGCADHDTTTGATCPQTNCTDDGTTTTCLDTSTVAGDPAGGDIVLLLTQTLTVPTATELGVDGVGCTEDDTGAPGAPATLVLSSGATSSIAYEAGLSAGSPGTYTLGPLSGSGQVFDLGGNGLGQGRLSGVLSGSFAAASQVAGGLGDSVTLVQIFCE